VRRAACYAGLFPVDVGVTSLAEVIDVIRDERGSLDGVDIAVRPAGPDEYHACAELGATWTLAAPRHGDTDVMAIASGSPTDVFPDDG
jgi:hypothetical protein